MLNRIKYILIAVLTGMCLCLPVKADDSTISYITINNMAYQDVEIVVTDKAEILVPFKQLADIFNIQYTANRVDKMISFKTYDGKEGMVPAIVYLENCSEVNIKNFIIQNVPNTAVIFNNCKKVKMDKVSFYQLHGNLPIVNFNSTETSFNGIYVDDKTRKNTIVTTFTTSNNTK